VRASSGGNAASSGGSSSAGSGPSTGSGSTAGSAAPRIVPFGDAALLVVLGESIDVELNRRAHALAAAVIRDRARASAAWGSPVPAYASVLVPYDPLRTTPEAATARLSELVAEADGSDARDEEALPAVELRVRYGGDDGPDLYAVAVQTGLDEQAVVDLHAGTLYRVFLLGFVPGFAYLGTLPDALALPRRSEPRTRVPAGSVAIAGHQTAVYPFSTPGGWHLIGRTDDPLWDPARMPPARLRPGQSVRFVPIRG
jgi:inhibitor of KinA